METSISLRSAGGVSPLLLLEKGVEKKRPIIVEGTVGCGKTWLIKKFAESNERVGPPGLVVLQLGDQTDSKGLFGSYQCTEIPCEFIWTDGAITKALSNGSWLVLEDIDTAPVELLTMIVDVAEKRELSFHGRNNVPAHPDFQIFGTIRLKSKTQVDQSKAMYLDRLWYRVSLPTPSIPEMTRLTGQLHPSLNMICRKLSQIFSEASTSYSNMGFGRILGTRDLVKWCNRIVKLCKADDPIALFREAADVLGSFCGDVKSRSEGLVLLGSRLGVPTDRVQYLSRKYKPDIQVRDSQVQVGRVNLPRLSEKQTHTERFALTRPASQLLEKIGVCVEMSEPVLLVGETGCGKTAAVQFLARYTGHKLHVINMSQHSDSTDLLGGFKPVTMSLLLDSLKDEYLKLFETTFPKQKNSKFLNHIETCLRKNKLKEALVLMEHTVGRGVKRGAEGWGSIGGRVKKLLSFLQKGNITTAFAFIEGLMLKAVQKGEWILLDEINMAPPETLSSLHSLMEGRLFFLDHRTEPITIHENFRLFACMNPATDTGKTDLTAGIRNRFTEFFVDELSDPEDLSLMVQSYLHGLSASPKLLQSIVDFYLAAKMKAPSLKSDSWGRPPCYSLRTLCRALAYASRNDFQNIQRSIFEAISMSFLTEIESSSRKEMELLIQKFLIGPNTTQVRAFLNNPIPEPKPKNKFREVGGYWIKCGSETPHTDTAYVVTDMVGKNLKDIARILSARTYPVLLQGETSVGKTSLIRYVAQLTGNTCIRINNHEHTDLEEYLGSYSTDKDGQLTFLEGPLVKAVRHGYWVILDELNLAPPEVLEALNRLLDDNREIFLPETQTVIKAHTDFILFATQNPPGVYGGRKELSRAFKNRFVELHFAELPQKELETILQHRCSLPHSYAERMVSVMRDLQLKRSAIGLFSGKETYMTLRDLFRWGERYKKYEGGHKSARKFFDFDQYLADQGYFVLAGRCRKEQDSHIVRETIKVHLKRNVDPESLFSTKSPYLDIDVIKGLPGFEHIVWTRNLSRMAVLLSQCLRYDEPALLVGETGGGKTTLCQLLAQEKEVSLTSINCHLMTEAGDFIGRIRPLSLEETQESGGVLFRWVDGPLVRGMKEGSLVLVDEISLAEDSVLERLNSVLEPERTLVVTEGGVEEDYVLKAHPSFQLMATMNPGGDYGKRELSRALRNRMTEIWCDSDYSAEDMRRIVNHNIHIHTSCDCDIGTLIVDFVHWFLKKFSSSARCVFTVRDIMSWVDFINKCSPFLGIPSAFVHGAFVVLLDSLGANQMNSRPDEVKTIRESCLKVLTMKTQSLGSVSLTDGNTKSAPFLDRNQGKYGVPPFTIDIGTEPIVELETSYCLSTPTCQSNIFRLLRAMHIGKPILLEGPPGVGKSSLVLALARATGHPLTRLNLSDQTDLCDLFGSDIPTTLPNGKQGFVWCDGPLLKAMKEGHWILLDEMNLATQSVLEGLNSCLDHRGSVFLPELGRSFHVKSGGTRFFAAQNPFRQGGDRRGLPKSFLNRFSLIYLDSLEPTDQVMILEVLNGKDGMGPGTLQRMVDFNESVVKAVCQTKEFGQRGGPWEFNLRDLNRWLEILKKMNSTDPAHYFDVIYKQRFTSMEDRERIDAVYESCFGVNPRGIPVTLCGTNDWIQIGRAVLPRSKDAQNFPCSPGLYLLPSLFQPLETVALCVSMNWITLLVGPSGSGKCSLVDLLAMLCGKRLTTVQLSSDTDALELLGSYEQITWLDEAKSSLTAIVSQKKGNGKVDEVLKSIREANTKSELSNVAEEIVQNEAWKSKGRQIRKWKKKYLESETEDGSLCFRWVDSPLLEAYQHGQWILLKNVNCCSPAVLDRLNSALEPGGTLTLAECGTEDGKPRVLSAHPDFRLFFTMNPKYGPISRAMRNRVIEVGLTDNNLWFLRSGDMQDVLKGFGLDSYSHATLFDVSQSVRNEYSSTFPGGHKLLLAASLMETGSSTPKRIHEICKAIFPDHEISVDGKKTVFEIPEQQIENEDTETTMMENDEIVTLQNSNSEIEREEGEGKPHFAALLVSEVVGEVGLLEEWSGGAWEFLMEEYGPTVSKHYLLSASTDRLLSSLTKRGAEVKELVSNQLSDFGDFNRNIPLDFRYYEALHVCGERLNMGLEAQLLDRIVIVLSLYWLTVLKTKKKDVLLGSPLHISRELKAKRASVEEGQSEGVKYLWKFHRELQRIITSGEISTSKPAFTNQILLGLFHLEQFLFFIANSTIQDAHGNASLQWMWKDLTHFLTIFSNAPELTSVVEKLDKVWSCDSVAESLFRCFYKGFGFVSPHSEETSATKFNDALSSIRCLCSMEVEMGEKGLDGERVFGKDYRLKFLLSWLEGEDCSVESLLSQWGRRLSVEDSQDSVGVGEPLSLSSGPDTEVGTLLSGMEHMRQLKYGSDREENALDVVLCRHSRYDLFSCALPRLINSTPDEINTFLTFYWLRSSQPRNRSTSNTRNVSLAYRPFLTDAVVDVVVPLCGTHANNGLPLVEMDNFRSRAENISSVIWNYGSSVAILSQKLIDETGQTLKTVLSSLAEVLTENGQFYRRVNELQQVVSVEQDSITLGLQSLKAGLLLLELATPPRNVLDPVVEENVKLTLSSQSLEGVRREMEGLEDWHRLVSTPPSLLHPAHPHPYFRALLEMQTRMEERISQCTSTHTVLRGNYSQFKNLVSELSNFFSTSSSALSPLLLQSSQQLLRHSQNNAAKLQGWLISADRVMDSFLASFSEYPDVIFPYLLGVLVAQFGGSVLIAELRSFQTRETSEYNIDSAESLRIARLGLEDPSTESMTEILTWALDADIPPHLQARVVKTCVSSGVEDKKVVERVYDWVVEKYTELEAGKPDEGEGGVSVEYRPRKKAKQNEEEEPDPEEAEIQEMFPTFFDDNNLETNRTKDEDIFVSETQLSDVMNCLIDKEGIEWPSKAHLSVEKVDGCYYLSIWIFHTLQGPLGVPERDNFLTTHVKSLQKLSKVHTPSTKRVNVYKDSGHLHYANCSSLLIQLSEAIQTLIIKYPEQSVLKQLLTSVNHVLVSPSGWPIMQMAATFENLLVECEEWEKVASRAVSLEAWMEPLRNQLLSWRKMEVECWESVLDQTEDDMTTTVLLQGIPLLEASRKATSGDLDSAIVLVTALQWIRDSNLGNYASKLKFLELSQKACSRMTCAEKNLKFVSQLRSVSKFFQQFLAPVSKKLTQHRDSINRELKEFMKVAKFQDLSTWTLKESAQKVHRQLFQMIKKHKMNLSDTVTEFLNQLSEVDQTPQEAASLSSMVSSNGKVKDAYLDKLRRLVVKSAETLGQEGPWASLEELMENVVEVRDLVGKTETYKGEDEKAKEKERKRALSKKQTAVGDLLRLFRDVGFSFRKGLQLNSGTLTEELLFQIPNFERAPQISTLFRNCAHARSVCLTALEKPHEQIQPQLSALIRGLIEVIPWGIFRWMKELEGREKEVDGLQDMAHFLGDVALEVRNEGVVLSQRKVSSNVVTVSAAAEMIHRNLSSLVSLLNSAPHSSAHTFPLLSQHSEPSIASWDQTHPEYQNTIQYLKSLVGKVEKMCQTERKGFHSKKQIQGLVTDTKELELEATKITDLNSLCSRPESKEHPTFFQLPLLETMNQLTEMKSVVNNLNIIIDSKPTEVCIPEESGTKENLLTIQRVVRKLDSVSLGTENCAKGLENTILLMSSMKLDKLLLELSSVKETLMAENVDGCASFGSQQVALIAEYSSAVYELAHFLYRYNVSSLERLGYIYLSAVQLFVKLLTKGFVENIPELAKDNEEGGTELKDFENAGMGEGEGVKDVTEEIEEHGQVEGLKGEEQQESQTPQEEEGVTPLEMDMDFNACLEDLNLDEEEESDGKEDEEEEEEEPNPDWKMGETDEPEEEQLDPNLWDKEEEESEVETEKEKGKDGADQLREEVVAKDDEGETVEEMENEQENPTEEEEEDAEGVEVEENMDLNDSDDGKEEEEEERMVEEKGGLAEEEESMEEEEEDPQSMEDPRDMSTASFSQRGAGEEEEKDNAETNPTEESAKENEPMEKQGQEDQPNKENNTGEGGRIMPDSEKKETEEDRNRAEQEKSRRDNRTLGDKDDEVLRREKIEKIEGGEGEGKEENLMDWAHAPDLGQDARQVVDSATLDEAQRQLLDMEAIKHPEDTQDKDNKDSEECVPVESADGVEEGRQGEDTVQKSEEQEDETTTQEDMEIISRTTHSTIHTVLDFYDQASLLMKLQKESEGFNFMEETSGSAHQLWLHYQEHTQSLAAELTENLRLILEPTHASKLKGDYRTGKRLNIRKLIPYIASNYRKNKIWLRRTKKTRRNYQILLAVDDSSSMCDNKTKQMAFESLALIANSLKYLEVGEMGICRFGEEPQLLHGLSRTFSEQSGASVLNNLSFAQNKTNVIKLLGFVEEYLARERCAGGGGGKPNQLLLIISDGRGLYTEGIDKAKRAVQSLLGTGVFVVFLVLDSPDHKDSITDIKIPIFNKDVELKSYLEFFPFPFYVILRQLESLPVVVGEALRQWFEIVSLSG